MSATAATAAVETSSTTMEATAAHTAVETTATEPAMKASTVKPTMKPSAVEAAKTIAKANEATVAKGIKTTIPETWRSADENPTRTRTECAERIVEHTTGTCAECAEGIVEDTGTRAKRAEGIVEDPDGTETAGEITHTRI